MKTKIKFLLTVLFLSFITINANAQISRNVWYGWPVIKLDNPVYTTAWSIGVPYLFQSLAAHGTAGFRVYDEEETKKFSNFSIWPKVGWKSNVVQNMEFANGKARINPKLLGYSHIDWGFRNYSLGYRVGYNPRLSHLGFEVEVDYIQDGYQIRMPDQFDVQQSIIKRMLSGQLIMKYRFGNGLLGSREFFDDYNDNHKVNLSKLANLYVEVGGGYQYALHYHDKDIHDKDAVNNGFIGIVGIGGYFPFIKGTVGLRYEHTFYDFYNDDFLYNGQPIFKGSKSTFGRLYAGIRLFIK